MRRRCKPHAATVAMVVPLQGEELATAEMGEMVTCMHVSPCGRMLVLAGERTEGGGGPAAGMRKAAAPLLMWLHNLQVSSHMLCCAVPCMLRSWSCSRGHQCREMRWFWSPVQVVMRLQRQLLPDEGDITALCVSREGCVIVGTARGDIVLLSPDPRRNVTARANLADCSR